MPSKKLIMTEKEEKIFNENKINIKKPKIITKKKIVKKENKEEILEPKIEIEAEDFKDLIIDISQSTHYELNYFALKLKIILPFITAYKKYENWFNNIFNNPKTYNLALNELSPEYQSDNPEYQSDDNEILFEDIKKLELTTNEILKLRNLLKNLEDGK